MPSLRPPFHSEACNTAVVSVCSGVIICVCLASLVAGQIATVVCDLIERVGYGQESASSIITICRSVVLFVGHRGHQPQSVIGVSRRLAVRCCCRQLPAARIVGVGRDAILGVDHRGGADRWRRSRTVSRCQHRPSCLSSGRRRRRSDAGLMHHVGVVKLSTISTIFRRARPKPVVMVGCPGVA
jgi:hypothetical protein